MKKENILTVILKNYLPVCVIILISAAGACAILYMVGFTGITIKAGNVAVSPTTQKAAHK